ncbi:MAG: hypothetical protein AB7I27_02630 [Bacteriovoracaceae bacterium]
MNNIITLMFIMLSFPTYAIQERGGGNAMVCFKNEKILEDVKQNIIKNEGRISDFYINEEYIESVEMLDIVEAKNTFASWNKEPQNDFVLPRESESAEQFHERIADRFKTLVPQIYLYINDASSKLKDIRYWGNGIQRIDDIKYREIIGNDKCLRLTIIAQFNEKNSDDAFIAIDSRFFALPETVFSTLNKVAARIHEELYYMARLQYHEETSDTTRNLTGLLFLKDLKLKDVKYPLIAYLNQRADNFQFFTFLGGIQKDILAQFNRDTGFSFHLRITKGHFESDLNFNKRIRIAQIELEKKFDEWYFSKGNSYLFSFNEISSEILIAVDKGIHKRNTLIERSIDYSTNTKEASLSINFNEVSYIQEIANLKIL